jgi:hypothetical protein
MDLARAAHTASWPCAGPTNACAISCSTVSRTSCAECSRVSGALRPISRAAYRQTPARRFALSKVTDQPSGP